MLDGRTAHAGFIRLEPCARAALDTNLSNPHARIHVPLARFAAEVFAAAQLLDDELLALLGADHFGRDIRAAHEWRAEFGVALAANGQYAVERDHLARRHVAVIDDHFLAFLDFILVVSVADDRVHVCTRNDSVSRKGAESAEAANINLHPSALIVIFVSISGN